MSLSRSTRNAPWLLIWKPGNSSSMKRPIIVSRRMKRSSGGSASGAPSRMKRSSWPGIGMRPFMVLPSLSRCISTASVRPLLRMKGKGCAGIDGDRRQDREDVRHEQALQPAALARRAGPSARRCGCRPSASFVLEVAPAGLLVGDEAGGEAVDGAQLLGRRQAVLRQRLHAGRDLAVDAGDAHHVELVEVGGRDRQEAQALQQRMALVLRLLEHAAVELQPGQLAVVEAIRALRRRHGSAFADGPVFSRSLVPGARHLK